jgi:hypothetical protein
VEASVPVTAEIDQDGHGPVDTEPAGSPDVLVHAEGLHPSESFRLADPSLDFGLDRRPRRVPGHDQVAGQRRHGRVIVTQRVNRPTHRPHGQHRPRRRDLMLFGERRRRTRRFTTAPHPAQPAQHGDPAQTRRIMQHSAAAAVTNRHNATAGTALLDLIGLDRQHQPLLLINSDIEHM